MYCACCKRFSFNGHFFYRRNPFDPYEEKPDVDELVGVCDYCFLACSTSTCTKPQRYNNYECNHTYVSDYSLTAVQKYCIFCNAQEKHLYS